MTLARYKRELKAFVSKGGGELPPDLLAAHEELVAKGKIRAFLTTAPWPVLPEKIDTDPECSGQGASDE